MKDDLRISRRAFLAGSATVIAGATVGVPAWASLAGKASKKPTAKLGLLTDVHHADVDARGTRFYRESMGKLEEAVEAWRNAKVDAAIELGDFIDAPARGSKELELRFAREASAAFVKVGVPCHYVLGNHCVNALSKEAFLGAVGQKAAHYAFELGGWTLLVLDACYRADGVGYDSGNFKWTDTDIPPAQQDWLRATLSDAKGKALVFVHQRLDLEVGHNYAIASSPAVRRILSESGKVGAVFMGHYHQNVLTTLDGVPYCTMHAVIEGSGKSNNAYSVLELFEDGSLRLQGSRHHAEHPLANGK